MASENLTDDADEDGPGKGLLIGGTIFPAAVVAFELATRMCASMLFDPMPSIAHVALVAAVPAINLWLWTRLRSAGALPFQAVLAGGVAAAVSLSYTIIFLPLYPISLIGILFYGLGLAPFAPLAALIASIGLTLRGSRRVSGARMKALWLGPVLGLLLIAALDTPQAATRLAIRLESDVDPASEKSALTLMRTIGDRDLLLRLCYDATGRPSGPVSALVALTSGSFFDSEIGVSSTAAAQSLYYRVTGDSFNMSPPPFDSNVWSFTRDLDFDPDRGGSIVGARARGLSLAGSRIDGSVDANDAVGYLEWTMDFANDGGSENEARATILLPPGAVVSRASLWINGEEREAAFAQRALAQAAYQQVVVRQRRDPLLVTTNGADRVMVQAFPVPAGGKLRMRIGITAPLDLSDDGKATLPLPAIVDRNFNIGATLHHAVWIEGDGRADTAPDGFRVLSPNPGKFRLQGDITDETLTKLRPRITAPRPAEPLVTYTQAEPDGAAKGKQKQTFVVQQIAQKSAPRAGAVMFVLDGSRRAQDGARAIKAAIARLPDGLPVGLAVAADEPTRVSIAPLGDAQRRRLTDALARVGFRGGQDNTGALADAISALEPMDGASLVWVHGPQPIQFWRDRSRLDQTIARSARLPRLLLVPMAAGPNLLLDEKDWYGRAPTLATSGDPASDMTRLADTLRGGLRWTITRFESDKAPTGADRGSAHIARLWAHDRILDLASTKQSGARDSAVALAKVYRLVEPISGAVVLETTADYRNAGLEPPAPTQVPTVPEPEEYLLLAVACALFGWQLRRARMRVAA